MKIAVAIIQNTNKEVLVIKRGKQELGLDGAELTWAFPGGKIEEGESVEQTVVREVKEELGLHVEVKDIIGSRQHPQFDAHITYVACTALSERIELNKAEVEEARWVSSEELSKMFTSNLSPEVGDYLLE